MPPILTLIAIGVPTYITLRSGILDVREEKLEIKRNLLEIEIKEFTQKLDSIDSEFKAMEDSLENYQDSIKNVGFHFAEAIKAEKNIRMKYTASISSLEEMQNYYEMKIDSLISLVENIKLLGSFELDENGKILLIYPRGQMNFEDHKFLKDPNGNFIRDSQGNPIPAN